MIEHPLDSNLNELLDKLGLYIFVREYSSSSHNIKVKSESTLSTFYFNIKIDKKYIIIEREKHKLSVKFSLNDRKIMSYSLLDVIKLTELTNNHLLKNKALIVDKLDPYLNNHFDYIKDGVKSKSYNIINDSSMSKFL